MVASQASATVDSISISRRSRSRKATGRPRHRASWHRGSSPASTPLAPVAPATCPKLAPSEKARSQAIGGGSPWATSTVPSTGSASATHRASNSSAAAATREAWILPCSNSPTRAAAAASTAVPCSSAPSSRVRTSSIPSPGTDRSPAHMPSTASGPGSSTMSSSTATPPWHSRTSRPVTFPPVRPMAVATVPSMPGASGSQIRRATRTA